MVLGRKANIVYICSECGGVGFVQIEKGALVVCECCAGHDTDYIETKNLAKTCKQLRAAYIKCCEERGPLIREDEGTDEFPPDYTH